MACKIDHNAEDAIPLFLCATCNPAHALRHTPEANAAFALQQRETLWRDATQQELLRTKGKIASIIQNGVPDPCVVPITHRIYASLVKKVARLEQELKQ